MIKRFIKFLFPHGWLDHMTVWLIAIVLALPMYLTLTTVEDERPREYVAPTIDPFPSEGHAKNGKLPKEASPSPSGYTMSLLMWGIPSILIVVWLIWKQKEDRNLQKAAIFTALLVGVLGLILDVIFGLLFFTFPNREAVMGWFIPGVAWGELKKETGFFASGLIPLEEVAFYSVGAFAIVLIYVWCDKYWLAAYDVKNDQERRAAAAEGFHPGQLHLKSACWGFVVFALGWFYRYSVTGDFFPPPWYLLFLTGIGIFPSMALFGLVGKFINYRALSVTLVITICISIFYEAVLGVPYQWWGFQPKMMTGIMIQGFSGVPVEEPMLWVCIVWACVIFFETIYTFRHGERRSFWKALKGAPRNYGQLKNWKKKKSNSG